MHQQNARTANERRYPVGAECHGSITSFRVWAPDHDRVALLLGNNQRHPLASESGGYFAAEIEACPAGTLYRFLLDGKGPFPDPASRFQPDGPHGPSMVVDPLRYKWNDPKWQGPDDQPIVYEAHLGTLTPEGTCKAAIGVLPHLRELGVNVIELMPVGDFSGRFGWGYDGVNLWAPTRLYGEPDDFRSLVDAAHAAGIAVILDVVYNHLGPDGNYLSQFSADYFTDRYENEWGEAINFDGRRSGAVREFFIANAAYWIDEFHFDGLRIDATQSIHDSSDPHVLREMVPAARAAAGDRQIWIVAENELQEVQMVRPDSEGGFGMDAIWNDDFHHSAIVALTGRHDAYYTDYLGKPQEFVSASTLGFLYQGQYYSWQKKRRGTVSIGVSPQKFVWFLENHDQVANSGHGDRLHRLTDRGSYRAMSAFLILGPATPMFFQGQEFASSAPFLYFADHEEELARNVSEGRRDFLKQFRALATDEMQRELSEPHEIDTFLRCKLKWEETEDNEILRLYRDLVRIRIDDPVLHAPAVGSFRAATLSDECFLLRHLPGGRNDRLLIVNLGRELHFSPVPEPLLAPPEGFGWKLRWSSESPRYGGAGTPEVETTSTWQIPGRACVLLEPAQETAVAE